MKEKSVLIVGAGIAGLTAAWHLAHSGWRVTVIERAKELRSGGYMMSLSGPGYTVAESMGLMPELLACHTSIEDTSCHDKEGNKLWSISYREAFTGIDWITLARTDLVKILHRALPESVEIRYGAEPRHIATGPDGVSVTLRDGKVLEADLLIGVRRQII